VMIATGLLASVQHYVFSGLIILVIMGALGKTLGAIIAYYIADKVEDLLLTGRVSRFLGITHEQIESFGARLGHGKRDYFIMTLLRALPIIPSSVLSVGCGFLKVRFKLFIISTFIGSLIRDFIYIYLGYVGTTVALSFLKQTASLESLIQIIVIILVVLVMAWFYFKRKKVV